MEKSDRQNLVEMQRLIGELKSKYWALSDEKAEALEREYAEYMDYDSISDCIERLQRIIKKDLGGET